MPTPMSAIDQLSPDHETPEEFELRLAREVVDQAGRERVERVLAMTGTSDPGVPSPLPTDQAPLLALPIANTVSADDHRKLKASHARLATRVEQLEETLAELMSAQPGKGTASGRRPNAAFTKPLKPSATLAEIVGEKPILRTEVTSRVWAYIKKNGLQDSKSKQVKADKKLRAVFGGRKAVKVLELDRLLAKHLK